MNGVREMGFDKDLRDLIQALRKTARKPFTGIKQPTEWPSLAARGEGESDSFQPPPKSPTDEKRAEAESEL
jgi:hypothetical protein